SWGSSNGATIDPWYRATVQAWRAAGIFPSFSNGNSGPGCNTSGSPGDNTESYASGAFDINGAIASFSSRGPGENGDIKPNLASPGVNVRSAVPGNGFGAKSGTSMASPHTSGAVALMWSAAPTLVGDIAQTEALLDNTSTDVNDLACGGTADDNHVWGEGKLDAFAAVDQSPRGPVGTVTGAVTDSATSAPIAGATVRVTGPSNRNTSTGSDGRFSMTLPVGDYTVSTSSFGYGDGSGTATVTQGQTTTTNIAMTPVERHTVSGHVRDAAGVPVANVTVAVQTTPIAPVTSAADGSYSIPNVPNGDYQIKASAGGCNDPQLLKLTVDSAETLDFALPNRGDSFGHHCVLENPGYIEGDTPIALTGDSAATSVALPFGFFFYGRTYQSAWVSTNGSINFLARSTSHSNHAIPSTLAPNAGIYPFWDDLVIDAGSRMMTKVIGEAPNRQFVIEWRNALVYLAPTTRLDFEAVLSESGEVSMRYRNIDPANPREGGNSATVGIENHTGTVALQYSFNVATLSDSQSIKFKLPANGVVSGNVSDFNDEQAVEGTTVRAMQGATAVATTTSDAAGNYRLRLLTGDYTVEFAKTNYVTSSEAITIAADGTVNANARLHTPRGEMVTEPLSFLAQSGQLRTKTLPLRSTSDLPLTYQVTENAPWMWTVPASGTIAAGATQDLTVRVDASGMAPGVHQANLVVATNAGRVPTMTVPITLVVPAYRTGVDVGGAAVTDGTGDAWVADQGWIPGGFGFLSPGPVVTSKKAIAGTADDVLFQTQRESPDGYRFDALPAGTYQVELNFAELKPGIEPGRRVFDVSLNGTTVLPNHDIVAQVGALAANTHEFTV
ncbi:MAG: carboxypeptidase regulatory-like domain-containing protein, partial [Actinomycetota bacterium]|nr:carboxypeptidase regulatory-like domain-containing protein [Actinomycetota bacterium]